MDNLLIHSRYHSSSSNTSSSSSNNNNNNNSRATIKENNSTNNHLYLGHQCPWTTIPIFLRCHPDRRRPCRRLSSTPIKCSR